MTAEEIEAAAVGGESPARLPVVAIVGRPNAGKSALFNRLVRAPRAIVDAQPGVTRDRNVATARWGERSFRLIDTGGFEDRTASALAAAVRTQADGAAAEADVIIAVFDGREGLNPVDRELMQRLRRLQKPVLFAVNKLDTAAHEAAAAEFFALGLDEVFPIAVAHGRGVSALLDRLVEQLPVLAPTPEAGGGAAVTLALVGRPNVGKSSLLNRILGYERAIVDAAPGTTRDPVDTPFRYGTREYLLVDTAGIRRRPRVTAPLERASAARALRALERAEIAILVVDATEGMTDQDARIAGYAWERGRALLLAVNKWDAVPHANPRRFLDALHNQYPTLADLPAVLLSARTGANIAALFPALEQLVAAHRRQLRTVRLNEVLAATTRAQAPASVQGKRPRFYYATQTASAPPTITVFSSYPQLVQPAYERYLLNAVRAAFGLHGTPLHLRFRARRAERA
jgi:GTP-binding protein